MLHLEPEIRRNYSLKFTSITKIWIYLLQSGV